MRTLRSSSIDSLRSLFVAVVLALSVSSCALLESQLYGARVPAVVSAADVVRSTDDTLLIRDQMVRRAGLEYAPALGTAGWSAVLLASIEYSDELCDRFIVDLQQAEQRYKAGKAAYQNIASFAATILPLVEPSTRTISIVTAALGLGNNLLDSYSALFLMENFPKIKTDVDNIRDAYKVGLAAKSQTAYFSWTGVAMEFRRYLDLCRVPSILARLNDDIGNKQYVPGLLAGNVPGVPVRSIRNSDAPNASPLARPSGSVMVLPSTRAPVQPPAPQSSSLVERVTGDARNLTVEIVAEQLTRICFASSAGRLGPSNSPQRSAIRAFQLAVSPRLPLNQQGFLDLKTIVEISRYRSCESGGFATPEEVGLLGGPDPGLVLELRENLSRKLGRAIAPMQPGDGNRFDEGLREAVADFRGAQGVSRRGASNRHVDRDLWRRSLSN